MSDENEISGSPQNLAADLVYAGPGSAQASARRAIADPRSTDTDRAEALAVLGRAAYYDNRISEAIRYLKAAMELRLSEELRSEVSLILAPALSKQGRSAEALDLLGGLEAGPATDIRAKALNQRGAILVELGELAEALDSFDRAANLHQQLGDTGGEGRALLNMGAAASEMGDQLRAEGYYERAWQLNQRSGQLVMCAMIEGNLGYLFSRKGDFGSALEWYRRGRESFAQLGDVDLLVAVLEADHATTLLDLGLNHEAYAAAEFARASSVAGSNQLLEVQAHLLRCEAQLRLGQFAAAETTLETVCSSATALGAEPIRLRSDYLRQRLRSAEGLLQPDPEATIELAAGLRAAAWNREALRVLVLEARALVDSGDSARAIEMLVAGEEFDDNSVDAIDRAHASALAAHIADDEAAFELAVRSGEHEVDRQRQLLSAAELQTRLGHRTRDLRELAISRATTAHDPLAILEVHDRIHSSRFKQRRANRHDGDLRWQLRDVRVGLQEAQLNGRSTSQLRERAMELEQRILEIPRDTEDGTDVVPLSALISRPCAPTVVEFFAHRSRLFAISTGRDIAKHDLGSIEVLRRVIRAQRAGLRRMAAGDDRGHGRVEAAGERLGDVLFGPLDIPNDGALAIVADGAVAGISWAGIPYLHTRSFFIASSVRQALTPTSSIRAASIGLLSGGGLDFAEAEVDTIADVWSFLDPMVWHEATKADARLTLESTDLVHIAAHGTFRSDNPFLSALHFSDGDITLIDLERQQAVPRLVILASCDSGAAIEVGSDQIGTADVLLSLGVDAVFASTLTVDDAAAGRVAIDLHRALAEGETLVDAMNQARAHAVERKGGTDLAAAAAFAVHGSAAILGPLELSRIKG